MDGQVRRRDLVEKWRNAEFEGRTKLAPRPAAPLRATFSHFATAEEWEAHRKHVAEAQKNDAVPF